LTYNNAKGNDFVGSRQPLEKLSDFGAIRVVRISFPSEVTFQTTIVRNLESKYIDKDVYIAFMIC